MRRVHYAFAAYAALALLSGFTLTGNIRLATLIFIGGLALKTLLAHFAQR